MPILLFHFHRQFLPVHDIYAGGGDLCLPGLARLYGVVVEQGAGCGYDCDILGYQHRRGDEDLAVLGLDDEAAGIADVVTLFLMEHLRGLSAEDDGARLPLEFLGTATSGNRLEVRTEGADLCDAGGSDLVVAVTGGIGCEVGAFIVAIQAHVHVAGHEGVAVASVGRCLSFYMSCYLVVADTDGGGRTRDEGDDLLVELVDAGIGVLGNERSAEVELIVGSTGEADDVRRCVCKRRIAPVLARATIVVLVGVGILVIARELAVVVVPEERVGDVLGFARCGGIVEVGSQHIWFGRCRDAATQFAQPVFVTYLRASVAHLATAVEVGYLALLTGGYEFRCERHADALPALGQGIDELCGLGLALVPHVLAAGELILDGAVEVLPVHEEMVVGGRHMGFVHHEMSVDGCRGCFLNAAVDGVVVVVCVVRL